MTIQELASHLLARLRVDQPLIDRIITETTGNDHPEDIRGVRQMFFDLLENLEGS